MYDVLECCSSSPELEVLAWVLGAWVHAVLTGLGQYSTMPCDESTKPPGLPVSTYCELVGTNVMGFCPGPKALPSVYDLRLIKFACMDERPDGGRLYSTSKPSYIRLLNMPDHARSTFCAEASGGLSGGVLNCGSIQPWISKESFPLSTQKRFGSRTRRYVG